LSSTAISIVDKETGERTSLPLKPSRIQLRALEWSPAGQWIAVLTQDERARSSILLVSRDGNTQHQILTEESQISAINWSRADAIYFLRQRAQVRELWKIRVASETGRAVQPAVLVLGGVQAGPNFAVSSDGRKLLHTREIRYSNLWVASLGKTPQTGASASRQLTSGTLADNFPAVSPDGTQITFVRNDGQASNVFVMPFTGGPARQLTFLNSASGAAAWSPDGTALAFCAVDNGVMKLWTLPVAGGAPRPYDATRCTSSTSEVPVAWVQPNTVLYQRTGNRNYHLLDLPSASEAPLVHNEAAGWVFAPQLSPDATQLAVFWNRSPHRGLFVLPWPVRDAMAKYLVDAAWPIGWSADGRSIYAYDMKASTVLEVRIDGSASVVLMDLSDRRIALLPAITPDKTQIVFSAHAIHSDVWLTEGFDPDSIQP
jgi:Tol biopolymer transport system component